MPNLGPFGIGDINEFEPGIVSEDGLIELIIKYNGDIEKVADDLSATVEILDSQYAIMTININLISRLLSYPQVEYIEPSKTLKYFLSESMSKACIPPVRSPTRLGLSGKGVAIGIIDSGIDITHPDFINENGESRVLFLWDQNLTGTPPAGFQNGVEYTNEQINAALKTQNPFDIVQSQDFIGHGTAVSGVAAGNGRASNGKEIGAAPNSSLIVVRLRQKGKDVFVRTVDIMRALKYVYEKARQMNMPVSINISYGTNNGSHAGDSLFETYIDQMTQVWKSSISVATGNEGSAGHHYSAVIREGETLDIEFVTSGFVTDFYLTLWKNFSDTFTFELFSPSGKTTGPIVIEQKTNYLTLDKTLITFFYGQPTHYNLQQELYFYFRGLDNYVPVGVWVLRIKAETVVDGKFDIWLPTVEDVTNNTAFLMPSVDTTMTLPSTALNVISVGGYNAAINSIADFSGRGYTRFNVYVKPDLVAPAVNVLSTRTGGGYDSFTGTSIAAPFVTGSAALMMEWGIVKNNDPFLYGQRIKGFLQKGAGREKFLTYPNPIWGYGTLCLSKSMEYLVESARIL